MLETSKQKLMLLNLLVGECAEFEYVLLSVWIHWHVRARLTVTNRVDAVGSVFCVFQSHH